jgi:hypothetical protein
VRHALDDITVAIASKIKPSSTTIATVGAYVVVVATTMPDRATGPTSSYLGEVDAETAVTHLYLGRGPRGRLVQRTLESSHAGVTHARTCVLDHAAELRAAIEDVTEEHVTVDVGARALEQAAEAWTEPL